MTVRKHFKQLVRERMAKTGESYTSARRQILKDIPNSPTDWHFAGSIPATTALRVLLAAAGVRDPHTGEPFTEAMLFGIAGGVGIGVAAFRYEKADFSSFFLAGRHTWFDDLAYFNHALNAIGIQPKVTETAGAKAAEKQLRETLEAGPCIAWVDMAHLPHRALPADFSGGGYHVVPIYRINDETKTALIGDQTDAPIDIPLTDLAKARGRIKKQAHRLLSIPHASPELDLAALVKGGLRTCHSSLTAKPGKGPLAMSTLESLRRWRDRLANSKDKECWEKMFPPGKNLWRALTWINLCIEWFGTGGGLCRPMMADFLMDAGNALMDAEFNALAQRYADLGKQWSELAAEALNETVPPFRHARNLYARYAELLTTNGTIEAKREVWAKLDTLAAEAAECFPLNARQCANIRQVLQERLTRIISAEETAMAEMAMISIA